MSTSSLTKQKLRKFEKIPIFIVENHNDVLEFVYRCLGSRRLPFTNNKIIHFDSHPDMTIPKYMPAEYVRNKDKLLATLSIENWLMPAVYAGHINQMIWMKPAWAEQIADGDYNFFIGDHCGFIRCDSYLEYFLSEGTYRPRCDLSNQKFVHLNVFTLSELLIAEETLSNSNVRRVSFSDCVDDANENFILDIDLDFFSTRNPFLTILDRGTVYTSLKKVFKGTFFDRSFDATTDSNELLNFTSERLSYLDLLESVFKDLACGTSTNELSMPDGLAQIWPDLLTLFADIKQYYGEKEIQWMLIYDAGCTFDSNDLPHHESSDTEIADLICLFSKFLRFLKLKPSIITISRSSEDDYCPEHQVDRIQNLVLSTIYDVYGECVSHSPILHYKDEEWMV